MSSRSSDRRQQQAALAAALAMLAGAAPAPAQQTQTQAPAVAAERVAAILAGDDAETVAELQAVEAHVQALIERVLPAVVALDGASGVLVRRDGVTCVVSSAHVTQRPGRRMRIRLHDGRLLRGETVGCDHRRDIGLIRVDLDGADALPVLEVGDSKALARGQWVLMLGHPSGRKQGREAPARLGRVLRTAQRGFVITDCTMQAGDSGGPLLDMAGAVVGINSRITGNLAENMHTPTEVLETGWQDMLDGKVVDESPRRMPGFGVPLDSAAGGLRVGAVDPGGKASGAGLRAGDVLVEVAGRGVQRTRDLRRALARKNPGEFVDVVVLRGDERIELRLELEPAR